jgi:AraC-like DNA-binding protein
MSEIIRVSTDTVEPQARDALWRDFLKPFYDARPAPGAEDRPMNGTVLARNAGPVILMRAEFSSQTFHRSRALVASTDFDHCLIAKLEEGDLKGEFEGRRNRLRRGDICIIDFARPFTLTASGTTLLVAAPRHPMEAAVGGGSPHGAVIRASHPVGLLAGSLMSQMLDLAETLTADAAAGAFDALTALIARCPDVISDPNRDRAGAGALRERISSFVHERLTDRDLGPGLIMEAFGISRAHLYRLFDAEGGVMTMIRDRRLDGFYRALVRPENAGQSIASLARNWGFSSVDQLQRNFRARFGLTPSEAREVGFAHTFADPSVEQLAAHMIQHAESRPVSQQCAGPQVLGS